MADDHEARPTFEAADVPALRRDLLDWIRDGRGFRFHSTMSTSAGTMLGHPELDGHPGVMHAYAEMLCEQERRTLREAELYYVTAEMTDLVRSAAADLPAFIPNDEDFPTTSGFIVFGTPLVTYRRPEKDAVLIEGRVAADFRDQEYEEVSVSACTWGPYDAGGNWKGGGVWMSFYRDRAEMLANIRGGRLRDDIRAAHARLVPDNEYGIQYVGEDAAQRTRLEEDLAAKDDPAYTSYWAKYLMTALLLMRQPLIYQRTEPTRRGLRRQLERAGYPAGDIRILDARPHRYTTVPRGEESDVALDEVATEETGRKITVRFPVSGFWRNQWYPSRNTHRPKWIEPHWRGPEDGEIVHPERVRVLRQHPADIDRKEG